MSAFALFAALGGVLGLTLAWLGRRAGAREGDLAAAIDARLPQIQCAQCGYPGCLPYARAVASGEAGIDQCPPGGEATVLALAELLGESREPRSGRSANPGAPLVAQIEESACVGCALCLEACPVDAIVGAPRQMHTVLVAECTGCELCLAPCPVDCIAMRPAPWGTPLGAA